jgi:hypothetical protein
MAYLKRFVCLANSRKFSGRCVAGIEITSNGLGDWVRPISSRPSEELAIEDRRYQNGQDVKLLDIVDVRFLQARPHACQTENHVIDDEYYWVQTGAYRAVDLLPITKTKGPLWVDGHSSFSGENDRIPLAIADQQSSSLLLVSSPSVTIIVAAGLKKRQVRTRFRLGDTRYCLSLTDPQMEGTYLAKNDGEYDYGSRALMCVSLGEPFDGFRYKLAASLIPV